jgi:Cu2+-exporting ATPase
MDALTALQDFPRDAVADPAPFVRRDDQGQAHLELLVQGAHCANCIARIESGLRNLAGVTEARLNLSTGKLVVGWTQGALEPRIIVRKLAALGFPSRPYDPAARSEAEADESNFLLGCIAVAGFGSAFVMGLADILYYNSSDMLDAERQAINWLMAIVAAPVVLFAGRPFFRSALRGLRAGSVNMDLPISLAILLSLGLSFYQTMLNGAHTYYDAAVMLPFFLLIGRYFEYQLRRRAQRAARDLLAMQSVTVRRIDPSGRVETTVAKDIQVGDHIMLTAGERLPADGVILSGDTIIDNSLVTGESAPVSVHAGDAVHAGAIILGSTATLRATARCEDSLVAELTRLLEAGQQRKDRYVRIADKAARIYAPAVGGLSLAVFVGWLLFAPFHVALTNAITILIVTCPCALGLSVPAVQTVATGRLFERGLLIKSGDALERLAEVDSVIFDKTGTLTYGGVRLMNPQDIDHKTLEDAARLARASRHPLARALALAAGDGSVVLNAHEEPGRGVEAIEQGESLRLGSAGFVGAKSDGDASELWYRAGRSQPVCFRFMDSLRPDAQATIYALRARGLSLLLLSGDRIEVTARIAAAAGIAEWRGNVDPGGKADLVDLMREQGRRVLMVGDGFNDAAALACADVSISPGTAVDATQAAADAVLRGDHLAPIVAAIDVARKARRLVLQNFALSAAYNVLAIPLAAAGLVTPFLAAVSMASSSLLVTVNALRLAFPKGGD